jgi:hypothetical protein
MQIVARASLLAFLTGPFMDPDQEHQEEFTAIANAVLLNAPASVTHFLYSDHENGDDPEIRYPEYIQLQSEHLINEQYTANGDSYYGVYAQWRDLGLPNDNRVLYHCYLGGSPLNSAPGFVLSTVWAD